MFREGDYYTTESAFTHYKLINCIQPLLKLNWVACPQRSQLTIVNVATDRCQHWVALLIGVWREREGLVSSLPLAGLRCEADLIRANHPSHLPPSYPWLPSPSSHPTKRTHFSPDRFPIFPAFPHASNVPIFPVHISTFLHVPQ